MATWAEKLDSQESTPVQDNPWVDKLNATEEEPTKDEKTVGQEVFGAVYDASKKMPDLYQSYGDVKEDIVRGVAAGLYKAGGDLLSLASAGVETVYDTGRIIGREGYKYATGDYPSDEPFKVTDYFSDKFKETTKKDVKAIAGKNQGTIGEYAQKIAEYAAPTQAITRQLITKGVALNADKTRKVFNVFEKAMMAAAKNPTAAIKMEQGVSALMASSGETIKQIGGSENAQLAAELATGLASGQILNTSKSIINWMGKKIPGSASRIGKIQAAEYLQEVFKNDPNFTKKLERGLQLQKETGIKMNLAELTNNPELKAALQLMDVHTAGTMTGIEARLAEHTKEIKKAFPSVQEHKESAIKGLEDMQSEVEIALDKQANRAVDNVLEQVDNAAPLDREMLGESGRAALDSSREAMELEVNKLYKDVGNPNIPTKTLVSAVREAKKSPLANDAYMKELDADLVSTLESNVLGNKQSGKVIDAPVKKIYLGRGDAKLPSEMSLESMRVIESRLKERIRIANAAGKSNEARILGKILNGVFEQYKSVKGIEANQIANLRRAAAASKRLHNIFDQGEVLLQSRIDVKGMERITTEGFVRNFVKPNSDTKYARTNEAVDGFYNAYGDMPEAKRWLTNAFGALLKEEITKQGGKLNPKAIRRFIDRHSNFLKRARISDKFDTVVKAVEEANIAEANKVLNYKDYQKTVVSKFIGSDDPVNFIVNASQTGKLTKLNKEINGIENKARRKIVQRGVREALWEGMKRRLTTNEVASGEEIILSTGQVRKMLDDINYGKQLKEGLGKDHYASLKKLIDIIDRISPDISKSAGLPKEHIDEKLAEKLMTGLRAAAHGFVRPDLIAAQMSMRGYRAITTKQAHNVLKEAMENPDFAKELLKMSTTIKGREIVGTMFSPLAAPIISEKETKQ